jgi:hypothetical protein
VILPGFEPTDWRARHHQEIKRAEQGIHALAKFQVPQPFPANFINGQ